MPQPHPAKDDAHPLDAEWQHRFPARVGALTLSRVRPAHRGVGKNRLTECRATRG
ncbi:hypothetical protein GCM10007079_20960 [Nocardiopsis terrae]|nr:hypothetical protein GCM10007079_20960 [Nocardiopsis terrae]